MPKGTFFCVDSHTCGCAVRVVVGGAPVPKGATASARRVDFIERFDWIRTSLMYEPRGHDMMSGSVIYPSTREDCDLGVVFIEVSGCLPMCGHGTMGTVTVAIERNLVEPREPGVLRLDTPAGVVTAHYEMKGEHVESVRLSNVASYVHATGVEVDCPELGPLSVDIAYGGNFYAIIEPQENYDDLSQLGSLDIVRISPRLRTLLNEAIDCVHPDDPSIRGIEHIMWTGRPTVPGAHGRNAVFLGERGIDRSPCGTGTSARMALLHARGDLAEGEDFIHESIIGSTFRGRVEGLAKVGNHPAIRPSVAGWSRITGLNTIFVDDRDPYAAGFQLA
ncbi:MAG: 4-hydroxyproline epimerase [Rhodospirillaceae bacterium]|jgi:4-hydroxyproline epimerase|nr:4-hydroxyproline epimerase [Rhodospirillaceae bacterium]MBT6117200.1 4-hydroxyproline epimerase [Rhodospirillaceae bacterium]